jgi:hypothetical protein
MLQPPIFSRSQESRRSNSTRRRIRGRRDSLSPRCARRSGSADFILFEAGACRGLRPQAVTSDGGAYPRGPSCQDRHDYEFGQRLRIQSGKVQSGKVQSGKVQSGKVQSGKVQSGKGRRLFVGRLPIIPLRGSPYILRCRRPASPNWRFGSL